MTLYRFKKISLYATSIGQLKPQAAFSTQHYLKIKIKK